MWTLECCEFSQQAQSEMFRTFNMSPLSLHGITYLIMQSFIQTYKQWLNHDWTMFCFYNSHCLPLLKWNRSRVFVVHMFVCFSPQIRGEDGCFLYGVFNGYDGSRVASFASQCLTAELLLGQLNSSHTDNDVRKILTQVCLFVLHVLCINNYNTSTAPIPKTLGCCVKYKTTCDNLLTLFDMWLIENSSETVFLMFYLNFIDFFFCCKYMCLLWIWWHQHVSNKLRRGATNQKHLMGTFHR